MSTLQPQKLSVIEVKDSGIRAVDIIFWGVGRVELFKRAVDSFKRYIQFDGRLRYYLCVNDIRGDGAPGMIDIAESYNFDGVYVGDLKGHGLAMNYGMDHFVTSPYMFASDEDNECVRPVPLNDAVSLMEENISINQIKFNHRQTMRYVGKNNWEKVERTFFAKGEEFVCTSSNKWAFRPALWRMSFIRPKWQGTEGNVHHHMQKILYQLYNVSVEEADGNFHADKLGTFIWGPIEENAYFNHIGWDQSARAGVWK